MGRVISDTSTADFRATQKLMSGGQHNGAYYYSQDIVKNIVPRVQTERPWDTLAIRCNRSADGAIVFLHHNVDHDRVYKWLLRYKDQIRVCSSTVTYEWAKQHGKAIYLPLSIDVEYVSQFKTDKTKGACYAGNRWPFKEADIERYVPSDVDFSEPNISREELLRFVAPYKTCYAIGRCAIEAKVLGCKIAVCDSRYLDPSYWKVIDNSEAAQMLQAELDKIDGKQ